jgi:hypothetical protein
VAAKAFERSWAVLMQKPQLVILTEEPSCAEFLLRDPDVIVNPFLFIQAIENFRIRMKGPCEDA